MNFREMYPTDRFYAADMKDRPWTLTFADPAVTHKLTDDGEVDETMPPIWHFLETKKVFPAVKTNGVCARAMFGDESDAWAGHKITLYPTKDESGLADDGLCIRVKGSPELERELVFKATIGRAKKKFALIPTKKAARGAPEPLTAPGPATAPEAATGQAEATDEAPGMDAEAARNSWEHPQPAQGTF